MAYTPMPENNEFIANLPGDVREVNKKVDNLSAAMDSVVGHVADMENPHNMTVEQIGAVALEEVDILPTANKIVRRNFDGSVVGNITGSAASVEWVDVEHKPASFPPSVATASTVGGIKPGVNISVEADGTLNNTYTLPAATTTTIGGIKIGDSMNVASDGTINYRGSGKQIFTENGVFVVPPGVTDIWVSGCGAGGGGYSLRHSSELAESGGAGASVLWYKVSNLWSSAEISVSIGRTGISGAAGGITSFGSFLSLAGGGGGTNYNIGAGGIIDTAGQGVGIGGDSGKTGETYSSAYGGDSFFGKGRRRTGYGYGGPSGMPDYVTKGGDGILIIEW